jgi:hypothetical protein
MARLPAGAEGRILGLTAAWTRVGDGVLESCASRLHVQGCLRSDGDVPPVLGSFGRVAVRTRVGLGVVGAGCVLCSALPGPHCCRHVPCCHCS